MQTVNPLNGHVIKDYTPHDTTEVVMIIDRAHQQFGRWKTTSLPERAALLRNTAALLRERREALALLMADEMGKRLQEGRDEIEKCAYTCEYYAEHGETFLRDEPIKTEAHESFVTYQPLGVILAIMPWNFPFWQVFRFAAPNLMAGNVGVLKHASNVCGCALAIEAVLRDAGFPEGCFSTVLVSSKEIDPLIEHPQVRGVTLTGSTQAGKAVAAKAGGVLKKTVLELGGSDAYVVLADADIEAAAKECVKSRLLNAGQSCIAAKRFIVVAAVKKTFEQHFLAAMKPITPGDPKLEATGIGPLARRDLRDALHSQVVASIKAGATVLLGGVVPEGEGAFYPPTVLSNVTPGMPAFDEELFGPVAAIIEAKDEEEAFALANHSPFGLGSAIFTTPERGRVLARTQLDAGQTFVNTLLRSDPRLPFGGTKESGYGRELGLPGMREFMNAKTVYIA